MVHWLLHPFRWAASKVIDLNYPISGSDYRFLAQCDVCGNYGGFTSVRGGELHHCNACGDRSKQFNFTRQQVKDLRLSSWSFWQSWKMIPYNWHTFSEKKKEKYLGRKK